MKLNDFPRLASLHREPLLADQDLGVEHTERVEKPLEVLEIRAWDDVSVGGRERRSVRESGEPADEHVLHRVLGKRLENALGVETEDLGPCIEVAAAHVPRWRERRAAARNRLIESF